MSDDVIGIQPENEWKEQRVKHIAEAICRFRSYGLDVKVDWINELFDLSLWLKGYSGGKK